ncbi:YnbE family lipoprotein [Fodinicurvata sp. EGI_FJ10296]|uniref:YnbE family lipoprotein n=1 Tax=Fodinicurvata sp. EGI_FJ10296 TaxID=3231908 RepID=UPI00345354CE
MTAIDEALPEAERVGDRRAFLYRSAGVAGAAAATVLQVACSPTVRVEPSDKPIEINLNIRIEQEVRIRIERELERVFEENSDIF